MVTLRVSIPAILVRHVSECEGPDEHAQHVGGADDVPVE